MSSSREERERHLGSTAPSMTTWIIPIKLIALLCYHQSPWTRFCNRMCHSKCCATSRGRIVVLFNAVWPSQSREQLKRILRPWYQRVIPNRAGQKLQVLLVEQLKCSVIETWKGHDLSLVVVEQNKPSPSKHHTGLLCMRQQADGRHQSSPHMHHDFDVETTGSIITASGC